MQNVSQRSKAVKVENPKSKKVIQDFTEGVKSIYDSRYKGIGDAPKFPHATTLSALLTIYRLTGDKEALSMAVDALEAMAKGGIYDQIEGGFYRYSVDAAWMVPHFEKMLYTNAELIEVYADAYTLTNNPLFAQTISKTIANIEERFEKEDLFFSASDADSDGEEGKYFVYDYDEAYDALLKTGIGKKDTKEVLTYLGITPKGNFEGKSNPHISAEKLPAVLDKALAVLAKLRQNKNYPFIDYKIQTSWNALYIKALFQSTVIDQRYQKQAIKSLEKLIDKLWIEGELYHQVVLPHKPKVKAYLEDYAFLIAALIAAHQSTLDRKYLSLAEELMQKAIMKFYSDGVWYMSDDTFRSDASAYDASYRSALAVMLDNLFQIASLREDQKLYEFAQNALLSATGQMFAAPQSFPTLMEVYLGAEYGWVILKGKKELLIENTKKISQVRYPFLLLKSEESGQFLACKIDRCFAVDQNLEYILEKIE